jgi:hypothetical protein
MAPPCRDGWPRSHSEDPTKREVIGVHRLEQAVDELAGALTGPTGMSQSWLHLVRQRVGRVVEELTSEQTQVGESWLSPRSSHLHRERTRLLIRLNALLAMAEEESDTEPVRRNLLRLVTDLHHHHQRVNDLFYDAVAMDVGGSE